MNDKTQTTQDEGAQEAEEASIRTPNGKPALHVKVYAPFKVYFDGMALSVSAENETGPFDILPRHHNFITLLKAADIVVQRVDETPVKIRISGGVMHVKASYVTVFLDV